MGCTTRRKKTERKQLLRMMRKETLTMEHALATWLGPLALTSHIVKTTMLRYYGERCMLCG